MTNLQRELTGACWRKSSHSGSGDQCVEVATLASDLRAVRDSKDPAGPALVLTQAAWRTLLTSLREA
ncbi:MULTISPECIES: DUF397 domain-containing protein [Actinomadura]|uniref:DUF397 domain-containing protein n=1 Tax=Actinomadura litoris TaxID=2678616 RepID=A0A7K1L3D5_9ACTN|nr:MULTISPECIES: DUF397 domain-containing protein [Actinomadura]MBT2208662.1 DUF397 domain-containing protein [Actinomadura sp. NEAU-AAG7]MUN38766.1 DUF397 domain-containing protein [Actinomadura litoris]